MAQEVRALVPLPEDPGLIPGAGALWPSFWNQAGFLNGGKGGLCCPFTLLGLLRRSDEMNQ